MGTLLDHRITNLDDQGFRVMLHYKGEYKYTNLKAQATRIYRSDLEVQQTWINLGRPGITRVCRADGGPGSKRVTYSYIWTEEEQ